MRIRMALGLFTCSLGALSCGSGNDGAGPGAGGDLAGATVPGAGTVPAATVPGSTPPPTGVDVTSSPSATATLPATTPGVTVTPTATDPATATPTLVPTPPTGAAGAAGVDQPTTDPTAPTTPPDPNPLFSFFTTSLDGLLADCAEQFPGRDCTDGFGGDLGGLEGADAICTRLAQRGNPGDTKTWRAFLSSTGDVGGTGPIHAIQRVGSGPWYNFNGLPFAEDVAGLMAQPGGQGDTDWGRPTGASVILQEMFTDENGDPVSPDTSVVDNHDTLTGSDAAGMLGATGEEGLDATCEDWTSNTRQASGGVWVGHSWPRSNTSGRHWISEHAVNGCEPGVFIGASGAPAANNFTVGGGGGYGAFYCFALDVVAPSP